jgi:hypothetical protein
MMNHPVLRGTLKMGMKRATLRPSVPRESWLVPDLSVGTEIAELSSDVEQSNLLCGSSSRFQTDRRMSVWTF